MVKTKSDIHIRWMERRDMLEVLDIERESFSDPWAEDDFLRMLRQRNVVGMVAESHERVIGYVVYGLELKRLYLFNIAVATKGMGVGAALVNKLKSKLSGSAGRRRECLECHVRETNISACKFFNAMGLMAIQVDRGFFEDHNGHKEDGYLFRFRVKSKATC